MLLLNPAQDQTAYHLGRGGENRKSPTSALPAFSRPNAVYASKSAPLGNDSLLLGLSPEGRTPDKDRLRTEGRDTEEGEGGGGGDGRREKVLSETDSHSQRQREYACACLHASVTVESHVCIR